MIDFTPKLFLNDHYRREGKVFVKKKNPHDEALHILKTQMDIPRPPQVIKSSFLILDIVYVSVSCFYLYPLVMKLISAA